MIPSLRLATTLWILTLGWASCQNIYLAPSNPSVSVFVNQSYFVSCKAPEATRIAWTKVGEGDITPAMGKIHVEEKNGDGLDLVFESIRKKNQGDYACKATIKGEEVEKKFTLSVFKPISFADTEEVQYATEGLDYTVLCHVGGDPVVSTSWRVRGRSLRPSPRYQVVPNGLTIKQVTEEDGGLYVCRAMQSNAHISDFKEMNITLKIQHKPRWFHEHSEETREAYGFLGGTVNITCSAKAEPGADFTWIKDNKTLQPNDDIQIFNSEHHSALQLYVYDESVFGGYECRATNMLGTMARVIILEEASKPLAPHFKIKIARPDSLVVEIEDSDVVADEGGRNPLSVTGYVVQFKQPAADWSTAEERTFQRQPHQPYIVVGMQQDTAYEIRVAAKTAAGTGDFSAPKMEKTKKWVATAAPVLNTAAPGQTTAYYSATSLTLFIAALLAANLCI